MKEEVPRWRRPTARHDRTDASNGMPSFRSCISPSSPSTVLSFRICSRPCCNRARASELQPLRTVRPDGERAVLLAAAMQLARAPPGAVQPVDDDLSRRCGRGVPDLHCGELGVLVRIAGRNERRLRAEPGVRPPWAGLPRVRRAAAEGAAAADGVAGARPRVVVLRSEHPDALTRGCVQPRHRRRRRHHLRPRPLEQRLRVVVPIALAVIVGSTLFGELDAFSGGAVERRFSERSTTNRSSIAEDDMSDLERAPRGRRWAWAIVRLPRRGSHRIRAHGVHPHAGRARAARTRAGGGLSSSRSACER